MALLFGLRFCFPCEFRVLVLCGDSGLLVFPNSGLLMCAGVSSCMCAVAECACAWEYSGELMYESGEWMCARGECLYDESGECACACACAGGLIGLDGL